jgi:hypothetical protein
MRRPDSELWTSASERSAEGSGKIRLFQYIGRGSSIDADLILYWNNRHFSHYSLTKHFL